MRYLFSGIRSVLLIVVLMCAARPLKAQRILYSHEEKEPWCIFSANYSAAFFPYSIRNNLLFPAAAHGFDLSWRCVLGKHFEFGPMVQSHYFQFRGESIRDSINDYGYHSVYLEEARPSGSLTHFILSLVYDYPVNNWHFKAYAGFGGVQFSGLESSGNGKNIKDSVVRVGYSINRLSNLAYAFGIESEYTLNDYVSAHLAISFASDLSRKNLYYLEIYGGNLPFHTNAVPVMQLALGICYRLYPTEVREADKSHIIRDEE